ncbi:glycosyltransferase [Kitasatospora sp. NPDC051914]|uniref:glycosyltransferase n=1 Tax=Kitasatospora sp. NPDC051914 TaxID=3154945 RepID=UPI00344A4583
MRILFSGTPAFGHLLPMLPLARAARRAGHDTAFLTHPSMARAVAPAPVLPAGPTVDAVLAEVVRRTGADATTDMTPATPAEFFGRARVDLGADEALAVTAAFGPDLVIVETADYLGRLAAAANGVPWVSHGVGIALDHVLARAMDEAAAGRFAARGLRATERIASIDPWPDSLQRDDWKPSPDRIVIRPEPYDSDDAASWSTPRFPGREDRPRVLVTLGTIVDDDEVLATIVASLEPHDVNVVVAVNPAADVETLRVDRTRVRPVGFVPMRRLLDGVDVVVSAGGAGTVLSALRTAVPMVLLPMGLDKPLNAERVANVGAAVVVHRPEEIGDAVAGVLGDPSFRTAAAAMARQMTDTQSAAEVLRQVLVRMP